MYNSLFSGGVTCVYTCDYTCFSISIACYNHEGEREREVLTLVRCNVFVLLFLKGVHN